MRVGRIARIALVACLATPALGQDLTRLCIAGNDAGYGLEVAVDAGGVVHLSRVHRVLGGLLHTTVEADGTIATEEVAANISLLLSAEVTDTGLLIDGDDIHICFTDARAKRMEVASRVAGVWNRVQLEQNVDGGACDIVKFGTKLVVAYEDAGVLRVATRTNAVWGIVTADQVPGHRVGDMPSIALGPNNALVVAHRDHTNGELRISHLDAGLWNSFVPPSLLIDGGQSPRAIFNGDELLVVHGVRPNPVDSATDVLLLRTFGELGGAFNTEQFNQQNIGAYNGAVSSGGEITVFTRRYSRSALFPPVDALYMYRGRGLAQTQIELFGSQSQRHVYKYLSAAHDPFDLPVLAYLDERTPFFGDPGGAPSCIYRPTDSDSDRLPDVVEAQFGTRVDDPDTDGDGRTDGEEVLLDGTDPTEPDGCDVSPETCNGRDDDCDDEVDENQDQDCYPGPPATEGVGPCHGGTRACVDGELAACDGAVIPRAETCNDADDDCDGSVDEGNPGGGGPCAVPAEVGVCAVGVLECSGGDFACVPVAEAGPEVCDGQDNDCDGSADEGARSCGVGACRVTVDVCVGGQPNACVPDPPAAADDRCDNVDDDCDESTDEGFPRVPTSCGVGECARDGEQVCIGGVVRDSCQPGQPNLNDAVCNALDEDCDGEADEDYLERDSACGVGACRSQGRVRCVDGEEVDDCSPGQDRADDDCDGIDDDCDGLADEDFAGSQTTCGLGECAAAGEVRCVDGQQVDSCAPGDAEPTDATCDGLDEDCDGSTDEAYVRRPTSCGVGACASAGLTRCVAGVLRDNCRPGTGADDDPTCDGTDDDCDGAADEDFAQAPTACGVGACVNAGVSDCVDGEQVDSCQPRPAAPNDAACDGIDSDCDGVADEDAGPRVVRCGVGACRRDGAARCVAGQTVETCTPGQPAANDASCDGVDDDCDGRPDEDYVERPTECGAGVCAAVGAVTCRNGGEVNTCVPGDPDAADDDCDGVDDNCNGVADENFQPVRTTCGVGGCRAVGRLECRNGVRVDSCEPNPAAPRDASCNAFDDDCDGRLDEDYEVVDIACGVGECQVFGQRLCVQGELVRDCDPGGGGVGDATCDRRDDDCDGTSDEDFAGEATECGVGACAAVGVTTCAGGVVGDTCEPGAAAETDETCDGIDDDCDGTADEDFEGAPTVCGGGACVGAGVELCVAGEVRDSCVPAGGGVDDSCDGIDQDCDGRLDEAFVGEATECGLGVCAAQGVTACEGGRLLNTCTRGPRQGTDSACDGIDADCDGENDERYQPRVTRCGVGACAAEGRTACVAGGVVDDCQPAAGAGPDDDCDGIDDDCDGTADEAYAPTPSVCGEGVCAAQGVVRCVNGAERDTCLPGRAAPNDIACDGLDEDCDGSVDEGYDGRFTRCGRGACEAGGLTLCIGGQVVDDCEPGAPAPSDPTCDGVDDDCDGVADEDHAAEPTVCGRGACVAAGEAVCAGGRLVDTCQPDAPAAADGSCDGTDQDCDGVADEDYQPTPVSCGVGGCLREGFSRCEAGRVVDACEPGTPAARDANCNNVDEDCNGTVDEDFVPRPTECGVGACASVGEVVCRVGRGRTRNTCRAGQPAVDDATCDGVDDDCDGVADEDFVERRRRCGVGACNTSGRLRCEDGEVVNGCTPRPPAPDDATCDGIDDDCDGEDDEDFVPAVSTCGVGGCQARGETECRDGRVADTCVPDLPAAADLTCDSVDDDCDQRLDEDFPTRPTACGVGACAAAGQLRCDGGDLRDSCRPGRGAEIDATCDGTDDDCDGRADEEYAPRMVPCGTGVCAAAVMSACVDGESVANCVPGDPNGADDDCDAVDDDCDGTADEAFPVEATECGVGACEAEGELRCEAGDEVDTCVEGAPAAEVDDTCDGVDDDCDELVDEHCPEVPDGGVAPPDASVAVPDGAVVSPDAALMSPDGGAEDDAGDRDAAPRADATADGGAEPDGGVKPDASADRDGSVTPDGGPTPDGGADTGVDPRSDSDPPPDAAADAAPADDAWLMDPDAGDGSITGDTGGGSEVTADSAFNGDIAGSGLDCSCSTDRGPSGGWFALLLLALTRRRRRQC